MSQPTTTTRILVTGAAGQIGTELTAHLARVHGAGAVLATDLAAEADFGEVAYAPLDVLDRSALDQTLAAGEFDSIYHLAAMLSAKGEKDPAFTWRLNMDGLVNVLEAARQAGVDHIFWPSSIAVFGIDNVKNHVGQNVPLNPRTMYGITKVAGEQLCSYYTRTYGMDVRSLRYPGIISHSAVPGGGTTDYAVEIFRQAVDRGSYTSFLQPETMLPMMYISDAVEATCKLMAAPKDSVDPKVSYNIQGLVLHPQMLVEEIRKHLPSFQVNYAPDFRQAIAESWPSSVNDAAARLDWGFDPKVDLAALTELMLSAFQAKKAVAV